MRDAPRDAIKDAQHQDKISKINLEEENLNKSKQDIERKIKAGTFTVNLCVTFYFCV